MAVPVPVLLWWSYLITAMLTGAYVLARYTSSLAIVFRSISSSVAWQWWYCFWERKLGCHLLMDPTWPAAGPLSRMMMAKALCMFDLHLEIIGFRDERLNLSTSRLKLVTLAHTPPRSLVEYT